MLKKRRGSAIIIGIGLSLLILIFSVQMVDVIVKTNENTRRSLEIGQLDTALETVANQVELVEQKGYNEFAEGLDNVNTYDDHARVYTVNDEEYERDIWISTGCPIPNVNVNSDYPFQDANELGTTAEASLSNSLFHYFDTAGDLIRSISMKDKCFGNNYQYENASHYYVYPTPRLNKRYRRPVTSYTDCVPGEIYDKITDSEGNTYSVNPLDHPCYWGKLAPGESVRIPLNKYGRDIGDVENLRLRVRFDCPANKSGWCTYEERIGDLDEQYAYLNNVPDGEIDDSPLLANWTLEIEDSGEIYTSAKGPVQAELRALNDCGRPQCRYKGENTEIGVYDMLQDATTINLTQVGFISLFGNKLPIIDINTNLIFSPRAPLYSNLMEKITLENNNSYVEFQLNNLNSNYIMEFQIVSSEKNFN